MSKKDKNISSFSSMMFSSQSAYDKGWIRIALADGEVVGFTCVRHKSRAPETMLYFVMVDPDRTGRGVGKRLMADLEEQTPHPTIALKVMKSNERAIRMYEKLGYRVTSDDEYSGRGLMMKKGVER